MVLTRDWSYQHHQNRLLPLTVLGDRHICNTTWWFLSSIRGTRGGELWHGSVTRSPVMQRALSNLAVPDWQMLLVLMAVSFYWIHLVTKTCKTWLKESFLTAGAAGNSSSFQSHTRTSPPQTLAGVSKPRECTDHGSETAQHCVSDLLLPQLHVWPTTPFLTGKRGTSTTKTLWKKLIVSARTCLNNNVECYYLSYYISCISQVTSKSLKGRAWFFFFFNNSVY